MMERPIRAAILTVSDRCSRGDTVDESGPALHHMLSHDLGAAVIAVMCVPDEEDQVAEALRNWSNPGSQIDLIVSTGGTGLAPRDITPEAAMTVIERVHPGLMELARLRCFQKTPRTFLSRGVAGTAGRTLILTLPGSVRGCTEMLGALLDILPHAIETLRGEVQDDGRPSAVPTTGRVVTHSEQS
jgi:molybdenum cofactor synthesis domain-containing protein